MHGRAGPFTRFQRGFEATFDKFRTLYIGALTGALERRGRFICIFLGLTVLSLGLVPFLGQNFFPEIKSGEIDMHFRTQVGTRIETSSAMASLVNDEIGKLLPGQVKSVIDNCGLPSSGINPGL